MNSKALQVRMIHDEFTFREYFRPRFAIDEDGDRTPVERAIAVERRLDCRWGQYAAQYAKNHLGRIVLNGRADFESAEHKEMQRLCTEGDSNSPRFYELLANAPISCSLDSPLTFKRLFRGMKYYDPDGEDTLEYIPDPADLPPSAALAWSRFSTSPADLRLANSLCKDAGKLPPDAQLSRRRGCEAESARSKRKRFEFLCYFHTARQQLPDENSIAELLAEAEAWADEDGVGMPSRSACYTALVPFPELKP